MKRFSFLPALIFILGSLLFKPGNANAQDFVYQPQNPAFGGSPLNYQWLLSSANIQNKYKKPLDLGLNQDPLANFQQQLQRQILSELTRRIVEDRFGEDFNLNQANTLKFGNFEIDITPGSGGVNISIFDVSSGQETSITIPNI